MRVEAECTRCVDAPVALEAAVSVKAIVDVVAYAAAAAVVVVVVVVAAAAVVVVE